MWNRQAHKDRRNMGGHQELVGWTTGNDWLMGTGFLFGAMEVSWN